MGRCDLDRVSRRSDGHDGDSSTENQSSHDNLFDRPQLGSKRQGRIQIPTYLADGLCSGSDNHADENHDCAAKHTLPATVSIGKDSGERRTDHRTADPMNQTGHLERGEEETYTV